MKKASAILIGLVVFSTLLFAGPQLVRLSSRPTGNAELATAIKSNAPKGAHEVAGFVYTPEQTSFAGLGADENTEVEIGSVTKTFTAELLRQAVERGEVTLDTKVKDIIDPHGAAIGEATLAELANHTAGLPRNPGLDPLALVVERNPYAKVSRDDVINLALEAKLKNQGTRTYSNLGVAFLGQLLAKKSGRSWEDMVQEDILTPLNMRDTYVAKPGTTAQHPTASHGLNSRGRAAAKWEMDGYAPAGAIRSTPADMAKFVAHVHDHGVPEFAWRHDDDSIWHNGGTGGYSTMLVFTPDQQKAAFVVTDTTASVNQLGKDLLTWQP
ncbi:serine hydrolase domain-containing protein [Corynebacterium epidermidicanis]|uniref:Penicillin-binding protein, beta-lactamase class C n=1 Tax=Corynebacterium epidermidicanis TaxID=1050174 RepID=A0A0G3GNW0_9CORY|nr:serine hydrolase domain-containing protein [Corynebacterium epidermidicanis]AKK02916.1 penicillin-binding protein, beta-lactamase class C [Corynebacterium epidermidicanis]